ncbi:MAG: tctB6 [Polaromonas sp.]|nr:tctB6 [Polaromonas sp.]
MFANRIILVCTVLLAAAYFYGTGQIPSLEIGDPLGPRVFPYLIGAGLLMSAAWLFLEMLQAKKAAAPAPLEPLEQPAENHSHLPIIAAVVAWVAVYFAVFERLGFLLATPIFLLGLMAYLNRGKWVANGLTVVLFTAATYVLFSKVLGVSLAKGLLGI